MRPTMILTSSSRKSGKDPSLDRYRVDHSGECTRRRLDFVSDEDEDVIDRAACMWQGCGRRRERLEDGISYVRKL